MQSRNSHSDYGKRAEYHVAHLLNHYTYKRLSWQELPLVFQVSILNFIFDDDESECINWYHETRYWMHVSDMKSAEIGMKNGMEQGLQQCIEYGIAQASQLSLEEINKIKEEL